VAGSALIAATLAYGLTATAAGYELGTATPPLLYRWAPHASPFALVGAAVLAAGCGLSPRLRSVGVTPARFALAVFGLALALRLGLSVARAGTIGWYGVFELGRFEASNEYLPALPAFDFGLRLFLDTFAEIGTSLPVHAIGHPPGLLVTMHALGIDSAAGLAALTIGIGALSAPLVYALGRELGDESRARTATLLYLFAPSAMLHGATSADALYATLALAAAVVLLATRAPIRALGPPTLALASFYSWANLAIGAVCALVALRRDGARRALALSAGCALGLVAFYGLLALGTGFDPVGAFRAAESVYREGVASGRPYAFWLFGSPVAFLIAAGLPLAWLGLRALGEGRDVALALFAVLAFSAVLGFTKAETERIYLFLVPLLCLAASTVLPERRLGAVLAALAVQALATELLFLTIW